MSTLLRSFSGKRAGRRPPLTGMALIVVLFSFSGFVLVFLKTIQPAALLMALAVPVVMSLSSTLLPRLFPMDRLLMNLINFLVSLGVLMQYRYSPHRGLMHLVHYGVGLIALAGCAMAVRHIRRWKMWVIPMILASCGLMALPFVFRSANRSLGATAWVAFGSFNMQPSEVVKMLLLLTLASLLSRRRVVPAMAYIGIMLLFLVLQRDLGTAAIYGGASLVLLYAATSSVLLIASILGGGLAAVAVAYQLFRNTYFLTVQNRISNWIDPFSTYNQQGGGYQIVQSLIAIANGGLFGTGLGLGNATVIPAYYNDFIFATVCNEFGVIFAVFIILVVVLIVIRCADIGLRSGSAFHTLLCLGAGAILAVQTFIIVGGVVKFIPMTGVTMPFLSYGGTSMISCMGILGMVQGTANRNESLLREDQRLAGQGEETP